MTFEPAGRRVNCPPGTTILDAARSAGLRLVSACGGQGTCGKCRVLVLPPGPAGPDEQALLDAGDLGRGYRLACRASVDRDLMVWVSRQEGEPPPPAEDSLPLPAVPPGGLDGVPVAAWHDLSLKPPDRLEPLADATRILNCLREDHGLDVEGLDPAAARVLPPLPRAAAVRGREVIAFSPRPGRIPAGMAVDLGTTRIAVYLVDLRDGQLLAAAAVGNPQSWYGADVISRLTHALQGPDGMVELQTAAQQGIRVATGIACSLAGIGPGDILEASLVGNTVMHHLLLGLPVDRLAVSPFVPVVAHPLLPRARELGLETAPGARAFLPPPIAGYVGSDHLALLEVLELRRLPGNHLAIDVGTNTEVTLKTAGGRLLTCSCASGPAFEGAHIRHGMRAAPGAVERVRIDAVTGRAEVTTVLAEPPVGIAGTGILEAVTELRTAGLLGPSGGLVDGPGVRRGPDGKREYLLTASEEGDLVVTQQDVQEVLLAKGAIRAGIEILLGEAGVKALDLDGCWVAGAFGTRLDPAMAVRVGMFPAIPGERFRAVGNAAGAGARLLLVFPARRLAAEALASQIEYLELGGHPTFAERFTSSLALP
ncbi:MAG: ASKHA domain-containing protein [bacterium]|nr:ASKHA domain-containing protein [bacterium]